MPLFLFGVESERDNLIICAHLKGNAMTTLSKRLCLTALLALSSFAFAASATAETSKLIMSLVTARKAVRTPPWTKNNGMTPVAFARR